MIAPNENIMYNSTYIYNENVQYTLITFCILHWSVGRRFKM